MNPQPFTETGTCDRPPAGRRLRWLCRTLEVFGVLALAALALDPNQVLEGWLRGEAFYQLRPTRYWRQQVVRCPKYPSYVAFDINGFVERSWSAVVGPSWWQRTTRCFLPDPPWPPSLPLRDEDPRALPVLRELLADSEPAVRMYAAETIGGLGPAGQPAVADLVRLLEDRAVGSFGYTVAEKAAWSLGQIGPGARSAGADLERCLDDPHHYLACAAALAVVRIGVRSGLDWLIAQLKSGQRDRRERAAIALGDARELARDAVPALVAVATRDDGAAQAAAIDALKFIDLESAMQAGVPPD